MLPNDNVSMSVGHLGHVFDCLQLDGARDLVPCVAELVGSCIPIHAHRCLPNPKRRHRCAWIGMQDLTNSATHGTKWFSGHVLHRAVIKTWSGCPTDIETLSLGDIFQLCKVRSFYIIDCTNGTNLFNTISLSGCGSFLSASLYVSKRCAYWDRLCRDVVGRWSLVGWSLVGCHASALWPNGAS